MNHVLVSRPQVRLLEKYPVLFSGPGVAADGREPLVDLQVVAELAGDFAEKERVSLLKTLKKIQRHLCK